MPLREFVDELDRNDRIRYRIRTVRGRVVDFVVQYETTIGDRRYPVVRWDASHNQGHRDIRDSHGETIDKFWLPEHMDLNDCLDYAVRDTKANGSQYRDRFMEQFS